MAKTKSVLLVKLLQVTTVVNSHLGGFVLVKNAHNFRIETTATAAKFYSSDSANILTIFRRELDEKLERSVCRLPD